jgi:hypothetical protein
VGTPTPVLLTEAGEGDCARGYSAGITTGNIVYFAESVDQEMADAV